MDLQFILEGVNQYGYAALFFLLWLGIVGMPIPDEVIVMSGGFITSIGILAPIPSFFVTYAGVVSGLSIGYGIGRLVGTPALEYLSRKKNMRKNIEKANKLIEKYGTISLVISYFFPIVRHVVPYIVGINKMPFPRYALFSYSTGFIWTLLLFIIGRYFGNYIDTIAELLSEYGWLSFILFMLIGLLFVFIKKFETKQDGL